MGQDVVNKVGMTEAGGDGQVEVDSGRLSCACTEGDAEG